MPELPEVETVRTELEKRLIGLTFSAPTVYYKRLIQSDYSSFKTIEGKKILSIGRKGKFLVFHLSEDKKMIFHLRMEGKLFVVDKENHSMSHLSLFIPFESSSLGLAFYDVRKFGVCYLLDESEEGPLSKLGKEPFEIDDYHYIKERYNRSDKPIKELLLDQTIMSGIGNIYADEICFACKISPFLKGSMITDQIAKDILEESKRILKKAIENHGSTVRSYKATQDEAGSFQDFLKVYSRSGKECLCCKKVKIEKIKLSGRGTSYCPICQHVGISVAVTGKIASGKSLVCSYFKDEGFALFSADDEVHKMYNDKAFLLSLKKVFPMVFTPELSKSKITELLGNDKTFKRKYECFINREVKNRIMEFKIAHDGEDKVFEIPLLFDAKMEKDFTYTVGVETTRQSEHLKERGEDDSRKVFNLLNSYDKNRRKLDYIITTDGTKEELKLKVSDLIKKIKHSIVK